MGDIDKQAFGGALGTATHGSGITLGAYHTQLEAMQIVDGRGEVQGIRPRQKPRHDRCHGRLARRLWRRHRGDDPQHGELPHAASPLDDADRRCADAVRGHDDGAPFGRVLLCAVLRPGAADRQRHHRGAGDGAAADGRRRRGDDAEEAAQLSRLVPVAAPPSHRFGLRQGA